MNNKNTIIKNFGMLIKAEDSLDIGNMFLGDKGLGVIEIDNNIKGFVKLIGKMCLTNGSESAEVSSLSDEIQIIKRDSTNSNDKIIIPYNTTIQTTSNPTGTHTSLLSLTI
jgi:hypothetical protein